VRFIHFSGQAFLTVAVALAASAFAACAPSTSSARLTAADVPSAPVSRESTPDPHAGKLVCRTNSIQTGTAELFLDWNGTSARGTLRKVAPSGETSIQNVRAERYNGIIIADDMLTSDLVVHAAMVAEHKGKTHMRLGDWKQSWAVCE
jgi:hypothetical protein